MTGRTVTGLVVMRLLTLEYASYISCWSLCSLTTVERIITEMLDKHDSEMSLNSSRMS
jgi:hypothetical protein